MRSRPSRRVFSVVAAVTRAVACTPSTCCSTRRAMPAATTKKVPSVEPPPNVTNSCARAASPGAASVKASAAAPARVQSRRSIVTPPFVGYRMRKRQDEAVPASAQHLENLEALGVKAQAVDALGCLEGDEAGAHVRLDAPRLPL